MNTCICALHKKKHGMVEMVGLLYMYVGLHYAVGLHVFLWGKKLSDVTKLSLFITLKK